MDIARSLAALLTWQWLILILALIFRRPLRRLFERIVDFRIGGEKGIQFSAPFAGLKIEAGHIQDIGIPNTQDRIDAKLIVLRDNEGRERAKLGVTDTDAVSFTMSGSDGNEHVRLIDNGNGSAAGLSFITGSGKPSAVLAGGTTGMLYLHPDENTSASAILFIDDGNQFLQLQDAEGKLTTIGAPAKD